jgi:hypothetical protein
VTRITHRTAIPESPETLPSSDLCSLLVHSRHVENGTDQHCPDCNDCNLGTRARSAHRHDGSLVFTEYVQNTRFIDRLRIDGVVGTRNVNDAFDCP